LKRLNIIKKVEATCIKDATTWISTTKSILKTCWQTILGTPWIGSLWPKPYLDEEDGEDEVFAYTKVTLPSTEAEMCVEVRPKE
jgi:hypothetical protein